MGIVARLVTHDLRVIALIGVFLWLLVFFILRYVYNPLSLTDPSGLTPYQTQCTSGDPVSLAGCSSGAGGGGGGCILNGISTACGTVSGVINAGSALQCLGNCGPYTGNNGALYQFVATTEGGAYVNPFNGDLFTDGTEFGLPSIDDSNPFPNSTGPQNNGPAPPDKKSCAARLAAGVLRHTGVSISNIQQVGTSGGHVNYTFTVNDPTGFQNILNNNPPFPLPFGIDTGYRYGTVLSTHIHNSAAGGFSGHTDLFGGHSFLAPLHLLVDVGIGHIPGVKLDFGCKAGL